MSRVERFEQIRRDARVEALSIRALAERHSVHCRTVRQALTAATPPAREVPTRAEPRLGPWKAQIEVCLAAAHTAPREQPHTACRIQQRPCAEVCVLNGQNRAESERFIWTRLPGSVKATTSHRITLSTAQDRDGHQGRSPHTTDPVDEGLARLRRGAAVATW